MMAQQQGDPYGDPYLLKVDNVTLQYKTPQHLVTATYKVDFTVRESERYAILGPSGCGKSTLLRAGGRFMSPRPGSIPVAAQPVRAPGPCRMFTRQTFTSVSPSS